MKQPIKDGVKEQSKPESIPSMKDQSDKFREELKSLKKIINFDTNPSLNNCKMLIRFIKSFSIQFLNNFNEKFKVGKL